MKKLMYQLTLLLALGLAAQRTFAASSGVVDTAKLFSPEAIQQAEATISKMQQQHNVGMLVETFPEIPEQLRSDYNPDKRAEFFTRWMTERAKANGVNGVYVLICKEPSYVRPGVGADTVKRGYFSEGDRDRLGRLMIDNFNSEQWDNGLAAAVQYVNETVTSNAARGGKSQGGAVPGSANRGGGGGLGGLFGSMSCMWIGLIVLGVFLVIRMFTRRAGGYGGYGAPGYGPQYRGQGDPNYGPGGYGGPGYGAPASGGFGRGMLGGLLGGMAGGWLYDRMSGGSQAHGAPPPDAGGPGLGAPNDQGQDFLGGGGGDFGGGGDMGGGGDSGGGGGDF